MRPTVRLQIRCCTKHGCGLRFPIIHGHSDDLACPRCGSPAVPVSDPYEEHKAAPMPSGMALPRIEVLLDNLRSIYNVGSIFRSTDGAGISHIHLCGITPTPHNPRLRKTALGADEVIAWSHSLNGFTTAEKLVSQGMRLWAIEGGERSIPIHQVRPEPDERPIVIVVGNEVCGVDPGILEKCEKVLSIPMQGIKTSLNAAVAFGIAIYTIRFQYMLKTE